MSTDTLNVVGPIITDNLPHYSDGYYIGYSNNKKVLIHYDNNTKNLNEATIPILF